MFELADDPKDIANELRIASQKSLHRIRSMPVPQQVQEALVPPGRTKSPRVSFQILYGLIYWIHRQVYSAVSNPHRAPRALVFLRSPLANVSGAGDQHEQVAGKDSPRPVRLRSVRNTCAPRIPECLMLSLRNRDRRHLTRFLPRRAGLRAPLAAKSGLSLPRLRALCRTRARSGRSRLRCGRRR